MSTWQVKKRCLSCKYYRLQDEFSGICRIDKKTVAELPMKVHDDICDRYTDCGQQYFIRTGWIKARKEKKTEDKSH